MANGTKKHEPKPRMVGEGVGLLRGPRRVGGPKFRAFFSLTATIFFLSSLSWGSFSCNFGGVFEAQGRSNVHVWSSLVVVCEPRRPGLVGPPGFHTTTREPKRAHLSAGASNTTRIPREDSRHTQWGPVEPVLWRGGHEEGCPAEGRSGGKWGERTKHSTHSTQHTTHNTPNTTKTTAQQHTTAQHNNNNTTQHTTPHHTTHTPHTDVVFFFFGRKHFHPKSISSTDTFIQTRFHPMNFSSNDIFIQ